MQELHPKLEIGTSSTVCGESYRLLTLVLPPADGPPSPKGKARLPSGAGKGFPYCLAIALATKNRTILRAHRRGANLPRLRGRGTIRLRMVDEVPFSAQVEVFAEESSLSTKKQCGCSPHCVSRIYGATKVSPMDNAKKKLPLSALTPREPSSSAREI